MSTFGENLKQIRNNKNISQGKLADMMEIHAVHVSRYERGLTIPSIDVVKKLVDILEVTVDQLVYGSTDEKAVQKITDTELLNMFRKVQKMEGNEIDFAKTMLKAFIFQKDMKKQLAS